MDANWYDLGADGDSPGERVGATLSVLAVDFQSKHLRHAKLETGTPLEPSSSDEQQYGLYLFGGEDSGGNQSNEVHIFYLQQMRWVRAQTSGRIPTKRSRHTANVWRETIGSDRQLEQLLIFGGVGGSAGAASNAVAVLDPRTLLWSELPVTVQASLTCPFFQMSRLDPSQNATPQFWSRRMFPIDHTAHFLSITPPPPPKPNPTQLDDSSTSRSPDATSSERVRRTSTTCHRSRARVSRTRQRCEAMSSGSLVGATTAARSTISICSSSVQWAIRPSGSVRTFQGCVHRRHPIMWQPSWETAW